MTHGTHKTYIRLNRVQENASLRAMNFFGAILAYLIIGAVLGWGMLLAVRDGNFWVLAISFLVYVVAFARIGCLPPSETH